MWYFILSVFCFCPSKAKWKKKEKKIIKQNNIIRKIEAFQQKTLKIVTWQISRELKESVNKLVKELFNFICRSFILFTDRSSVWWKPEERSVPYYLVVIICICIIYICVYVCILYIPTCTYVCIYVCAYVYIFL